jgi:hypothetical protein
LSAAVTADPALTEALPGDSGTALCGVSNGFGAVSLIDHHPGQCRWIVSDVWPVMYCGAPVVNSSSWCEQHSRRVFNARLQSQGASLFRLSKIFRPHRRDYAAPLHWKLLSLTSERLGLPKVE